MLDKIKRKREKIQNRRAHNHRPMIKACVECGKIPAHFWGNYLCEECFRKYLAEKVDSE